MKDYTMNIFEREENALLQVYKRLPIAIDHAEGCRLFATDGSEYLDFLGGIAVNTLGHSHPAVVKAVCDQAKKYMHVSNYIYQEPQIALAEALKKATKMDRIFFANSGAEANEGAIKLARRYGSERGKTDIVSFSGGFHGRTYGTLSVMDKPKYKDKMGPFLGNIIFAKYNDINELRNVINERTAAVILEFIQGEGGVIPANQEFVNEIAKLRKEFNFIVIADEIQAGTGRTGKFLSCMHYDFKPEIVTLAKGIGGGLPLGVLATTEDLASLWGPGSHGTTFGGNPLACAAGLAVMNELENGILDRVGVIADYFIKKLNIIKNDYQDKVLEIRGKGLFIGLQLSTEAGKIVQSMLKYRVISNSTAGNVLRIIPPLIITEQDIDKFCVALEKVLAKE